MHSRKTIFLTGASGNMGAATLHELMARADRFKVKALVLPRDRGNRTIAFYRNHPALDIIWGDLTNYDDVLKGVTEADQVLHIGGMVSPYADRFPDLTMKVNVGAARNIVKAIKAQPDPDAVKLVYIGTVAQTGDRPAPIHWGRTGDPIKISRYDHYAVSKTIAESIVAESGLKHWVSLRQTGIGYPGLWRISDPIVFHTPLNTVLEWVTVGDAGRLAANTCEDNVPAALWRRFFNIGGGAGMRVMNHQLSAAMSQATGGGDFRDIFTPNLFATRNFHGQWYTDSDALQALVPFRREVFADFVNALARSVPFYVKLAARYLPNAGRKRIRQLAEGPGGPLHWIANNDEAHINAYFGSRAAWEAIPGWDRFDLKQLSLTPTTLDHGYDESKSPEAWTKADLQQAAQFRGGICHGDNDAGPHAPTRWQCTRGHGFEMTPNLILRGGHWCPTCMLNQDSYADVAARSPFFRQVFTEGV
jgi:nucleoside-diphosphate-sugar epimerase